MSSVFMMSEGHVARCGVPFVVPERVAAIPYAWIIFPRESSAASAIASDRVG